MNDVGRAAMLGAQRRECFIQFRILTNPFGFILFQKHVMLCIMDNGLLVRRNRELEEAFPHLVREDSPSRKIGHAIAASPLSKVTHEVRMMSLDNGFSREEVEDWVARMKRSLSLGEGEPVGIEAARLGAMASAFGPGRASRRLGAQGQTRLHQASAAASSVEKRSPSAACTIVPGVPHGSLASWHSKAEKGVGE